MSECVTLADVERLCWRLSGWTVEQRDVDRLLAAVTAYAGHEPGEATVGEQHTWDVIPEAPVEGAERPVEAPEPPSATEEPPQPPAAPQAGVQRIEVTGTLTLVCARTQDAPRKKRQEPRTALKTTVDGVVPETERTCRKCGSTQPIEFFVKDSHGLRGRKTACRDCENKRKRDGRTAAKQRAAREAAA